MVDEVHSRDGKGKRDRGVTRKEGREEAEMGSRRGGTKLSLLILSVLTDDSTLLVTTQNVHLL